MADHDQARAHDYDHSHDALEGTTREGHQLVTSRIRESKLRIAIWLNIAIVAVQVVFGTIAHSLGLIADAGHNLTDIAVVAASLAAVRLARRPATTQRSFGYHRATIIAAQANATAILVVTALITYEALRRLAHPNRVDGRIVVVVAMGAAVANLFASLVLRESHAGHGHGSSDLNMRSARLHMAGDTATSIGVAAAGAVIAVRNGWYWLDPAISIAVGFLLAFHAWKLLRHAVDVLLESTPRGLDTASLSAALAAVEGVEDVHDLHVWELASDVRAMSAHLVLSGHPSLEEAQLVGYDAKAAVSGPFGISHATLELECESCRDDGTWCALS